MNIATHAAFTYAVQKTVKSTSMELPDIEITTWGDLTPTLKQISPQLFELLDPIDNIASFKIVKARYPFGAKIIDQGQFYLHIDGKPTKLDDPNTPPEVAKLLDYDWHTIPCGVVSQHTFESHIQLPSHVTPYRLMGPGTPFSFMPLFDRLDPPHALYGAYSAVAGCRSLVTLPKLTNRQYNQRLQKAFKIPDQVLCPKSIQDQWHLFKAIANSDSFHHPWQTELLLFSDEFSQALHQHADIKATLLENIYQLTAFVRNEGLFDLLWSYFLNENVSLSTRNSPHVCETVKYLINIATQWSPGFTPAISNHAGPITGLMDAIINTYKIRYFLPIFMELHHYDKQNPIYYSVQKPTIFRNIREKTAANQTINELLEIKQVLADFTSFILNDQAPFPTRPSVLVDTLSNTQFTFYHPKACQELGTRIEDIYQSDPRFNILTDRINNRQELHPPENALFFHGAIKINPK